MRGFSFCFLTKSLTPSCSLVSLTLERSGRHQVTSGLSIIYHLGTIVASQQFHAGLVGPADWHAEWDYSRDANLIDLKK